MNQTKKKNSIRKVILVLIVLIASIFVILNVPEESSAFTIIPFFIGGVFGYANDKSTSKVDIVFHHLTIIIFFLMWYFSVPNTMQSVFFLLGALTVGGMKREMKMFDQF